MSSDNSLALAVGAGLAGAVLMYGYLEATKKPEGTKKPRANNYGVPSNVAVSATSIGKVVDKVSPQDIKE